jgi:hypothetical protein
VKGTEKSRPRRKADIERGEEEVHQEARKNGRI